MSFTNNNISDAHFEAGTGQLLINGPLLTVVNLLDVLTGLSQNVTLDPKLTNEAPCYKRTKPLDMRYHFIKLVAGLSSKPLIKCILQFLQSYILIIIITDIHSSLNHAQFFNWGTINC